MKYALAAIVVAGCTPDGNPDVLWLAPSSNGQDVTLSAREPFQY
ncbi:MAG: hypothetical protein ABI175_16545 [Polyangiales bacterium]